MKKQSVELEGCVMNYYPAKCKTDKAFIMVGMSRDVILNACEKYMNDLGVAFMSVPAFKAGEKYTGMHSVPVERAKAAAEWLKSHGIKKIGTIGGSTTGMLALLIASLIPDISLVFAFTPCDFVMQGFYSGKKEGGITEWPADGESVITVGGEQVPFAPYGLGAEEYYDMSYGKASKQAGELTGRAVFEHVESSGIPEEAYIKAENIRGKIVLFGAEDDTLWDTAKYIRRMEKRLASHDFEYAFEPHIYTHGTHFIFPQAMLQKILPFGINFLVGRMFKSGRAYPKKCEASRRDVQKYVEKAIREW